MKGVLLLSSLLLATGAHSASSGPTLTYAALGDSYAAGDGAGYPISIPCSRFSEAYPVQVARQLPITLRNLACGGSLIDTVRLLQVPWIGDSDVATIQVGGNEAEFFFLLNECVHQWFPVFSCEKEIARAQSLVQSASYIERFDNLISKTKKRMKADSTLLVLGYAHFFNEKTVQCDHVSFSKTDPQSFLTREKRRMFNEVLDMVNVVIQGAAEAHDAVYVDIDKVFEGHRFCEEGVIEPAEDASWFFNDLPKNTPSLMPQDLKSNTMPSGFINLTRVFHPTIQGHTAIADELVGMLLGRP